MINSKLARRMVFGVTFLAVVAIPAAALAMAATTGTAATIAPYGDMVRITRAIAAGVVMCVAALSAAFAQARIGAAAAGTSSSSRH
jgi:hypothetical protein